DHVIDRIAETLVVEPHALGQFTEKLNVRPAFTKRLDRLIRNLQIVMPVRALQFFVLEEGGRGKNDVSVVGGISEELFVHNRKQIGAKQAANYVVVVRANCCGIGVVNEERFDRGILNFIQRLAQFDHVQHAGLAAQRFLHQVGAFKSKVIQFEGAAGRELESSTNFFP